MLSPFGVLRVFEAIRRKMTAANDRIYRGQLPSLDKRAHVYTQELSLPECR